MQTALADSVLMARLEVLENPPPLYIIGRVVDFTIMPGAESPAADTLDLVVTLFSRLATGHRNRVVLATAGLQGMVLDESMQAEAGASFPQLRPLILYPI